MNFSGMRFCRWTTVVPYRSSSEMGCRRIYRTSFSGTQMHRPYWQLFIR